MRAQAADRPSALPRAGRRGHARATDAGRLPRRAAGSQVAERAERRERQHMIDARFPAIKRLQDFRFADNPNVPQATIAALAEGSLDRRPRVG